MVAAPSGSETTGPAAQTPGAASGLEAAPTRLVEHLHGGEGEGEKQRSAADWAEGSGGDM